MKERRTKSEMDAIRDTALGYIESVPYRVTLRWVFYRLLQDGVYSDKAGGYNQLTSASSRWRHEGHWPPDIIDDDTRSVMTRGVFDGLEPDHSAERLMQDMLLHAKRSHFHDQPHYIEIWFEARGMIGQFKHYTKGITLRPFGGDYTIEPKYKAAKDLEARYEQFGKPIKILYFGDRDDKGDQISHSATYGPRGLAKWCDVDFEVVRCGLTAEQARRFDLPKNPDKPDQWQWESLSDAQASELITTAVKRYIDVQLIESAAAAAQERLPLYIEALQDLIA